MMSYEDFSDPKMMMSDSLRDVLPLEQQMDLLNDSNILVVLACIPRDLSLSGTLAGSEVKVNNSIKIDISVTIQDAFSFMSNLLTGKIDKRLSSLIFSLGEKVLSLQESIYKIDTIKIVDLQPTNEMCILAVDLIKQSSEEK